MNIGLVSQALPYLPSRGGFRLYGGNLIRHLSRRHRIDQRHELSLDECRHRERERRRDRHGAFERHRADHRAQG